MDAASALVTFSLTAFFLTISPGLDTALVLRTCAVEGGRQAVMASLGIALGLLGWTVIAALGLKTVLAVSETAFIILRYAGAAYLLYLGGSMLRNAFRKKQSANLGEALQSGIPEQSPNWLLRGFLTNLLNPKVGVFFISFLPQFIPAGENAFVFCIILGSIQTIIGAIWFLLLVACAQPLIRIFRKQITLRLLDGVAGSALIAFGVGLTVGTR